MEPRLIQQQSQKLILSPQIRQYLKLLQLPVAELEQAVETELTENPVLEEQQPEVEESLDLKKNRENENPEVVPGKSFEAFDRLDENFQESYTDFSQNDIRDLTEKKNFQEGLITKPEVLSDFLMWQIRFLEFSQDEKRIAQEIIGNIDEDGYLRSTLEEIAAACQCLPDEVLHVLEQIQELDPPGIGARNLQEALILQIRKQIANRNHEDSKDQRLYEIALKIVTDHLPLLEKRDWLGLSRLLMTEQEMVKKCAAIIGHLDPKPGRSFYTEDSVAVSPDASIYPDEDREGRYKIDIHDERIPEIRINPYYRRLLRSKDLDEKSRIFLKEKIQTAMSFMQALKLRKSTLRAITEEVVKAQTDFLDKGYLHLKPLRLKDIANTLGIHESTVSRALQGKYVATPQGMIPYKSFFSTRFETSDGMQESQKSIMEKMRILIEKESSEHPLSDQEIVALMKNDGIKIARRTVAKYRDLLKILPSHMRRKK